MLDSDGGEQVLANIKETEPLSRSAAIRTLAKEGHGHYELEPDADADGDRPLCSQLQLANGSALTPDQSRHMASQLQLLVDETAGLAERLGRALPHPDLSTRSSRGGPGHGAGGVYGGDFSAHGPHVLDAALDRATGDLMVALGHGGAVERWWENRYASLERYSGFLVMFHRMAADVAAFWPLSFDIARSQSQLRVATTAAPISAAELEKEWASDAAEHIFKSASNVPPDPTLHRDAAWTLHLDRSGSRSHHRSQSPLSGFRAAV